MKKKKKTQQTKQPNILTHGQGPRAPIRKQKAPHQVWNNSRRVEHSTLTGNHVIGYEVVSSSSISQKLKLKIEAGRVAF
eukprot:6177274-Amphidinium_carterae.1